MPHPVQGYRLANGTRVPGVTTILGRFKESGALIQWAYKRGRDGLELYESRDKAAELGTITHELVEIFIKTLPADYYPINLNLSDEDARQVYSAYDAFREWWDSNKFEVVEQERQLVSEAYRYGGTPDAIAQDGKGRRVLLDWKTSDGVYADHLYQLAAYRLLWNETHPDMPLTGGSHLCRFSKQHGDFAHHYYPDLTKQEEGFLLMRRLYDIDAETKKRT